MKIKLLFLLCFCSVFSAASMNLDMGKRSVKVSQQTDQITKVEIIVQEATPLIEFAASELADYLNVVMGVRPEIRKSASGDVFSIYLGDGAETRKAGIKTDDLPEEGFVIRRRGKQLFIAGLDSK